MRKIFISYRRADSKYITENVYRHLEDKFGRRNVFLDVEPGSIPYGEDFRRILEDSVNQCKVVLVIIGQGWADIREDNDPTAYRLDNPDDFVRIEVEAALNDPSKIVIPVLVNGAFMPSANQLPDSLAELPYRSAAIVREGIPEFGDTMRRLTKRIRESLPRRNLVAWLAIATSIIAIFSVIVSFALFSRDDVPNPTNTPDAVEIAAQLLTSTVFARETADAPTPTPSPNQTSQIETIVAEILATETRNAQATIDSFTDTPSPTHTASNTPSPTNTFTATVDTTGTAISQATESAQETLVSIASTNDRATVDAQATANAPTNTPQPTSTSTNTPTFTLTVTPTQTASNTPTATLTPSITPSITPNFGATATAESIAEATSNAQRTQVFIQAQQTLAAQDAIATSQMQQTIDSYTDTPTNTPTITPSPTRTPRPTRTPTPTDTPIPSTAFLYTEDFEDSTAEGWEVYSSDWSFPQEDGNVFWHGTGPQNYPQTWLGLGDFEGDFDFSDWDNYAFEVDVRFSGEPSQNTIFVCARAQGGETFYTATISSGNWQHIAYFDGTDYTVLEETQRSISKNRWYTIRFELQDNDQRVFLDDQLLMSSENTGLPNGGIGFYMGGGEALDIDNLRVWKLD